MRRAATPKLGAYSGLAALGLLGALISGRPEIVALAAPFALIVVAGLLLGVSPDIDVRLELDRDRALEGEGVELTLTLASERQVAELELYLELPHGLSLAEGHNPAAMRLGTDLRRIGFRVHAEHWGGYLVGEVAIRTRDPFGLFVHDRELDLRVPLKIYPRAEALRHLVRPHETQVFSGNQVARAKGEGIEFADLRPFTAGDRIRRINWRASARGRELWVNEHHPERNTDVVVFLDSFAEARRGGKSTGVRTESTLDLSVRAAASLLAGYIGQRDRVGFVSFGGVLRWLQPGTGLVQLYRVVDALLDTEITLNYAWKGIDLIPAGTLPPKALVVALTPLLDERSVTALLDLRGRGFDLAIVDVSPIPFAEPGREEVEQLAYRLWAMRREALRSRYERVGAAVVEWREGTALAAVVEEVTAFRRYARYARA
jgi:uncharacterized protein (DUF58 family)